ncbi:hypothetical protein TcYC6_0060900 [Trypanosoma cruzi]|uniref:Uncharacterized protein n=1 Tax=Trypanosoma cruzi (strain CL Brener) TaxID=353153 RepID=Q4CNJ5_TRYCC|nr:hypothetical protein Tc00.1047053510071.20 [Trypanosoma cruzi]EAN81846.1 hypothetical protein Tc00.1047053510071.20 [Trypanosoma cruzi]KAF8300354.1 hypothetical protein TcYC6_0060940 [Trypanosoma cruzi]KAF8300368.1 hypothetical protein TcYC6_0060900 [Trypanosoma cruzi]|eukprot:XP_803292.1 hypothetical protein [Trypanosoma cruzi strain CL Brener]
MYVVFWRELSFYSINCAIGRWKGFNVFLLLFLFFVCVRVFVRVALAFPLQSPHFAVGSRRGYILVCSCDLFVNGASHGATAVSAGGVAPGVGRVCAVTLAPPLVCPVGGATPVTHDPCLLATRLSFFFPCLCSLVADCTV